MKRTTRIKNPKDFGKVAVLLGGTSAEREVSLKSGNAVTLALQGQKIDAHPIDVQHDIYDVLKAGKFDRVFIVLHGRGGEDGVMQALLQTLNLPYTGTGVQGSALGMDKMRTKLLWRGRGLPTPDFVILDSEASLKQAAAQLGFPCIVKPVHEGSSIGISKVSSEQDLPAAWKTAAQYDREIIAERWITGGEYTASILIDEALPVIKMETPNSFYDYEAKYLLNTTRYLCPCGLAADKEAELKKIALSAFDALGASGWGRIDFMLDQSGSPWLIEANTVPGMTDHSLVPMAAKQAGYSFAELVWLILETTCK